MSSFGLEECLDALEYNWNRVNSYTSIMILLFFALVFLYLKGNKCEKAYFVYPGIFYLFVLLNPVVDWILINRLGFESRMHRFFWALPITFILAYVCLKVCRDKKKQGVFLLGFIMVLWLIQGRTPWDEEHYLTENIYKVENKVVELSKAMHEIDESEYFKVYINEIHPNYTIRQYDPAFQLISVPRSIDYIMSEARLEELSKEQPSSQYALAGYFYGHYQVDMEALYGYIKALQIKYLILDYEEKEFVAKGWVELAAKTEDYYIYRVFDM